MSENVVLLLANILVIIAWGGALAFIIAYSTRSPWRRSAIGRTLMYRALVMFALLTYALTARWLEPVDWLNYGLGLGIYALVAFMEWRLFMTLRDAQKNPTTSTRHRYEPIKNAMRRLRRRKENADG